MLPAEIYISGVPTMQGKMRIVAVVAFAVAACMALLILLQSCREAVGPQSIDEAAVLCEDAGFFFSKPNAFADKDDESNFLRSFTVCNRPIDLHEINLLSMFSPPDKWIGIVRVVGSPGDSYPAHLKVAHWGKVFVIGDPAFVDVVTSIR